MNEVREIEKMRFNWKMGSSFLKMDATAFFCFFFALHFVPDQCAAMIWSACEHDTGQRHIEGSCPLIPKQKAFKVVLNQMGSCGGRLESVLRTKQGFPFRYVTAIEMQSFPK